MKLDLNNKIILLLVLVIAVSVFFSANIVSAQSQENKLAAIFPGSIQDADWNSLGYTALQKVASELEIQVNYSEQVAVPDVTRVVNEYIDLDYNILWIHGTQYNSAIFDLAEENPDVTFIVEQDTPLPQDFDNIITIKRNYYIGHYVLGALASEVTETGKIGFVGGLEISWTIGVVNAIQQAVNDVNADLEFNYIYVGSFNDPLKTKQATESLINNGVDVIMSGVNLGNYGMFRAVENADKPVYVTSIYTDKSELSPEHFLTSDLFNYNSLMTEIVDDIVNDGKKSGLYNMEYGEDKGRYIKLPVSNVSENTNEWIEEIAGKVASGEIEVEENLNEIEIEEDIIEEIEVD
ncbi:MAG: BMP family protein [Halanaerobiales bacterium]